jgi:hypothetical protein
VVGTVLVYGSGFHGSGSDVWTAGLGIMLAGATVLTALLVRTAVRLHRRARPVSPHLADPSWSWS